MSEITFFDKNFHKIAESGENGNQIIVIQPEKWEAWPKQVRGEKNVPSETK